MLKNMRPKVIRYETDLVLVASCPIQWQAPRLESFVQGLPGESMRCTTILDIPKSGRTKESKMAG